MPGWNPNYRHAAEAWAEALISKFIGLYGTGVISGTTEVITLMRGALSIASPLESVVLGILSVGARLSVMLTIASVAIDVAAHAYCSHVARIDDATFLPSDPVSKEIHPPGGTP